MSRCELMLATAHVHYRLAEPLYFRVGVFRAAGFADFAAVFAAGLLAVFAAAFSAGFSAGL